MTKWIKATEQLPEQRSDYSSDRCIVAIRTRNDVEYIETGCYSWDEEAWVVGYDEYGDVYTNDVIAWMPLPDFPKEM